MSKYKMNENKVDIIPLGWIKKYIHIQIDGLTGHIENAGEPYFSCRWDKPNSDFVLAQDDMWKWVPFEQIAYWMHGAILASYYDQDKILYQKVKEIIYNTINQADDDGYIGPSFLKKAGNTPFTNRWPHVVFFRAVISLYYQNHDISLINAIEKHYLSSYFDHHEGRNVVNVETMLLVYEITKNKDLLDLAIKTFIDYQNAPKDPTYCDDDTTVKGMLSNKSPYEHGVSYIEIAKLGAMLYVYTKNRDYLKSSINAIKKIQKYHMLPDGVFSSNEYLRGKNPNETHETCNVTDFTWTLGYLLKITKDAKYADMIENAIFNAGIGSVLEDFKSLQYFSGVNQIVLANSVNTIYRRGTDWSSYRPGHPVQCCPGNVNRFMPAYVLRMWMQNNGEIISTLFGESEAKFKIKGHTILCKQETNYPFSNKIKYSFIGRLNKSFKFSFRIPSWATSYSIKINNQTSTGNFKKGFMTLDNINCGDIIYVSFDDEIEVIPYLKNGVVVRKGPLLYSLGSKGKRVPFNSVKEMPNGFKSYNIYPDIDFNFGIDINEAKPKFIEKPWNNLVWDLDDIPYSIEINARKIPGFNVITKNKVLCRTFEFADNKTGDILKGKFEFTPDVKLVSKGYKEKEKIILYPYGASKLRLTVFPKILNYDCETRN